MLSSSIKSMFLTLFFALCFALAGTTAVQAAPDAETTVTNAQEVGGEPIHAFGDDEEDEDEDEDEEEETW